MKLVTQANKVTLVLEVQWEKREKRARQVMLVYVVLQAMLVQLD